MWLVGTALGKGAHPTSRDRVSQTRATSQQPSSLLCHCKPLSPLPQEAVRLPLMKKQKLHTGFSEVRADLAQLPSVSTSPHNRGPHHLKKTQFLPPSASKLGQVPVWSSPQRPTPAQASTFQFPPSQLRDGQRDVVCLGGNTGPGNTAACTQGWTGSWRCSSLILGGTLARMRAPTLCSTSAKAEQDLSHQWGN